MQNLFHLLVLLGALFGVAAAGRFVARLLRLPTVIGEIALSILLGPVLLHAFGPSTFAAVLPEDVTGLLKQIGEAGLVLFLVGIVHQLDHGTNGLRSKTVGRITLGSFVLPLLTGLVFAAWVLWLAPAEVRGTADVWALVMMLAVAMSVTAVPVLARIIEERKEELGRSGDLSMMASMLIDTPAWLLLAVALGLAAGGLSGVWIAFATIAVGGVLAFLGYRVLGRFDGLASTYPRIFAVVLGLVALGAGNGVHAMGLTSIFGAFLVGLMIPKGPAWERVVGLVCRTGRVFVPVFFVVAGMTLATGGIGALPWFGVVLAVVLGVVGKVGGGYLGSRWGGEDRLTSLKIGVLVNTRGLTEIVVLQVGYTAGLLTPGLFVALLVMALVTTTLTGPVIDLIDRRVLVGAR
ncbi:cation:proton antiporter [Lentzea alba]|uniref:cation:proton antiporter n=1 Tax=Lentzea alba TaxID=2714351 RepID=UPI0039BEE015